MPQENVADPTGRSQDHDAAVAVAHALERLIAVIERELNAEASEGVAATDPAWADAIATVVTAAEASYAVLDRPDVTRALNAMYAGA